MEISWIILAAVSVAFALGAGLTFLSRRVAGQVGMVDQPAGRKSHGQAMPMLGGAAIWLTLLLMTLPVIAVVRIWAQQGIPGWVPESVAVHVSGAAMRSMQALGILLAVTVLHGVGWIDDRRGMNPWVKLAAQCAAALFVVLYCDVRVLTFAGPWVSCTLTVLWLVTLTNSFNFLDNMDGLAAGVAAICAAALLAAALAMGQWFVSGWCCIVLGAMLGFLLHNFPPAKTFMGDNGSLVVGFLLGVLSCMVTYVPAGTTELTTIVRGAFVPLCVMAIPLYDTASVMLIRFREGRSLMVGDNRHFSHRLRARGMGAARVALTVYICTACTAIAATVLPHTRTLTAAVLLLVQAVLAVMVIALLESSERRDDE